MRDEELLPGVELLESMRSVGYSFDAAIADLIDNSITAGATRIDIVGDPVEAQYVIVADDGRGMDADEIRDALQLAGSVAKGQRAADDLGRFGLGLKTASLSQARQLTVASLRDGAINALQWDIDHVRRSRQWVVRVLDPSEISALPGVETLMAKGSGTVVLWRELDVLLSGEHDRPVAMARLLTGLREHLSLTYHRYLDGEAGATLRISVNGTELRSIDPFLSSNPATQRSSVERVPIEGQVVEVCAFVLPHHSKLRPAEKRRRDLGDGMREAQGLYIYRNLRLISHGNWAGIFRRAELSKQSRVRVDFPNSLDHLWKLDIMKSRAEPPAVLRRRMSDLLTSVTRTSERVHTFRARKDKELDPVERLWNRVSGRAGYWYEVNPEHPALRALESELDARQRRQLAEVLRDLSSSFPVEDLYASAAKNDLPAPKELEAPELIARITALRAAGLLPGLRADAARALRSLEPFDRITELDGLVDVVWEGER